MLDFGLLGTIVSWFVFALVLASLGFLGFGLKAWTLAVVVGFVLLGVPWLVVLLVAGPMIAMTVPGVRRQVSIRIMNLMDKLKIMPTISDTETTALEAGTTWVDAELFSGKPNFDRILKEPYGKIAADERAFIDNQVKTVCAMVTDWEIFQQGDLPERVWDYLKKERFFGMIVPKEYGGLGFSALGISEVLSHLAIHSTPLTVTCMVPNSLGPGELLAHYGTQKQKDYYLPRLARGEEVPCFALTEPNAGSDAGSIESNGVIFKDTNGELCIRLNWDKRYITLASVSTLIGLAIKLKDPENLLGKGSDLGITCVLVPAQTPGVVLGKRHNPMGVPFHNCPTKGTDVVVSIDQIIGGPDGAGRGWQMLMECLAAGRAVSLPSQAAGLGKGITRLVSAYAAVRRQFGTPIGKFEGIEEPIARIVGKVYTMEAARIYTCAAVDAGLKPAVISAIAKYNQTELVRSVAIDGMDVLGGAAISRGPRNKIANHFIGMPISVTVEGANILTRTMIIFGQGALRCHPFAYKEVKALQAKDYVGFDEAFWGHIGHVVSNASRSFLLSLTRGRLASVPKGPTAKYYRKLAWASASFAIMADIAMASLGGTLKMREKLTGRYADVLSWMYLAAATLRRYHAEGYRKDHKVVFEWAMDYAFARIQEAFDGIFNNFDVPVVGTIFRYTLGVWSRLNPIGTMPRDSMGHEIAKRIQIPGDFRDSLTEAILFSAKPDDAGDRIERAFTLCYKADEIFARIGKAVRDKRLPKKRPTALVKDALAAGVITENEAQLLHDANLAREDVILVDAFDLDEFRCNLLDGQVGYEPVRIGSKQNEKAMTGTGV